jgi:hypothetical protein
MNNDLTCLLNYLHTTEAGDGDTESFVSTIDYSEDEDEDQDSVYNVR